MAKRRLRFNTTEMAILTYEQAHFLGEYMKDLDMVRACGVAGITDEQGRAMLRDPNVRRARQMVKDRLDHETAIDAEWLLWEAVDNHELARQAGNLSASNKSLEMIGRMSLVDAFAEQKIQLRTDDELMQRLNRGRTRARERGIQMASDTATSEPTPDFLGDL